jgi:hypothetical protein
VYLVVNHAWHGLRLRLGQDLGKSTLPGRLAGGFLTFIAVVFAWVFFRADSLQAGLAISRAMLGLDGFTFTGHFQLNKIAELLFIVWVLPNTQQIMGRFEPALPSRDKEFGTGWKFLQWQPNWVWLVFTFFLAITSLSQGDKISEFLYFQF